MHPKPKPSRQIGHKEKVIGSTTLVIVLCSAFVWWGIRVGIGMELCQGKMGKGGGGVA